MGFFGDITRVAEDVGTGGLAEFTRSDPFGVPGGGQYMPLVAGIAGGTLLGNPALGAQIGMGAFSALQQAQSVRDQNAQNAQIAAAQMAFSADQAKKQMDFQGTTMEKAQDYETQMSNTAVQRRMADLKAAGLNPSLAAGDPASSPSSSGMSGAMGSSAGYTAQAVPPVATSFLSTATQLASTMSDINLKNANAEAARKQAGLTGAKTPAAEVEGRVAGWLLKLMDKLSSFSGKSVQPGDVKLDPMSQWELNSTK